MTDMMALMLYHVLFYAQTAPKQAKEQPPRVLMIYLMSCAAVQTNDDIDAVHFHSFRQILQTSQANCRWVDVVQLSGCGVIEMIMRLGIGIVEDFPGIHYQLAHQTTFTEQVQGVVDGRAGNIIRAPTYHSDHLLRREMVMGSQ